MQMQEVFLTRSWSNQDIIWQSWIRSLGVTKAEAEATKIAIAIAITIVIAIVVLAR